jgi:hypothetical protein
MESQRLLVQLMGGELMEELTLKEADQQMG